MTKKKLIQNENNIETDNEIVEKPKRQASEKQLAHLANIREKAKIAKSENKQIVSTVKQYTKNNIQSHPDYSSIKQDIGLIKEYLSQQELRKINKQKAKEAVDKKTYEEYEEPIDNIFR